MVTPQEKANLDELAETSRLNKAPRTAGQVGIGAATLVLFDWIVRGYADVDLDPFSDGTEMPLVVSGALTTLGAYLISLYWNRKRSSSVEA